MTVDNKNGNCLICGERLRRADGVTSMQCMFCGDFFYTNLTCENGHYVCDECHMSRAVEMIIYVCERNTKKEAISIAYELMMNKWVRLHGPEHPFLVAATLLTAYRNREYGIIGSNESFAALLNEANIRASKIAISSCGYWGCCGEAIGCGIFASLILRVSPMSVKERGAANLITSKALEQISKYGGPRCDKRESFLAILSTSEVMEEHWGLPLTDFQGVECMFHDKNADCINVECPFFPQNNQGQ